MNHLRASRSVQVRAAAIGAVLLLSAAAGLCSSYAAADPFLFQASFVSFSAGNLPISVAIGDLNGDGRPDLVVANTHSNSVSALLGNGNGTFSAQTQFGTGSAPNAVAIGDLNGDGRPDLAVANLGSNSVSVLLGHGDGSFGTQVQYATGNEPISVAIGDLNGDGQPDLAVANASFTSNSVSVLLGHGDGSFGAQRSSPPERSPFRSRWET